MKSLEDRITQLEKRTAKLEDDVNELSDLIDTIIFSFSMSKKDEENTEKKYRDFDNGGSVITIPKKEVWDKLNVSMRNKFTFYKSSENGNVILTMIPSREFLTNQNAKEFRRGKRCLSDKNFIINSTKKGYVYLRISTKGQFFKDEGTFKKASITYDDSLNAAKFELIK